MTNEEAKKMLEAKLECMKRETSGTDIDCNYRNCDECSLCYEQGNMGEQKEALDKAIKALEQQPCEDCISREEAIRVAEQGQIQGYEWQFKELCNLPSVTPWTGWTPASQHPEPNTAVLLYVKYKSSRQHTYQLGMWNANKQAWEDWRTPYQLEEEFEVIAWMELPEIYEEDNNEW